MTGVDSLLARAGYRCMPLHPEHETMFFDTGRPCGLSQWLSNKARIYQAEDLCQVWVLASCANEDDVLGYFTLSAHSLVTTSVEKSHRAASPQNRGVVGTHQALPAHLLGKFALDSSVQGRGVGPLLMACVYDRYLLSAQSGGSKLLVLEAREAALVEYYHGVYGFVAATGPPLGGLTTMYKTRASIRVDLDAVLQGAGVPLTEGER